MHLQPGNAALLFPQLSVILSKQYTEHITTTGGELSKQGGVRENQKEGGLTEEEGIGRKVQDRSYGTGIRVIFLTPSTPIHPLR